MAEIDIEVLRVDPVLREKTVAEVSKLAGPPDATVLVKKKNASNEDKENFSESFIEKMCDLFSEVGEVVLIR